MTCIREAAFAISLQLAVIFLGRYPQPSCLRLRNHSSLLRLICSSGGYLVYSTTGTLNPARDPLPIQQPHSSPKPLRSCFLTSHTRCLVCLSYGQRAYSSPIQTWATPAERREAMIIALFATGFVKRNKRRFTRFTSNLNSLSEGTSCVSCLQFELFLLSIGSTPSRISVPRNFVALSWVTHGPLRRRCTALLPHRVLKPSLESIW
jgi:hypothetical protein